MATMKFLAKTEAFSFSEAFSTAAKVTRSEVFGTDNDRWLPINNQDDAKLPFLGYVGANFRPGGIILMAINPGGGTDKYIRTKEDERLCPKLKRLKSSTSKTAEIAVSRLFQSYIEIVPTWNLFRIINPVLEATNSDLSSIALLNLVPFRTRGDSKPIVRALNYSWHNIICPLLPGLKPSKIIALGIKCGRCS